MDTTKAIDYLSKDITLHIDMIEGIKSGNAQVLHASSRGVLVYFQMAGTYMMSAQDTKTAEEMIESVAGASMFVAHQDFYIPAIQDKFSLKERLICQQAVYLSQKPISEPENFIAIRRLDERYLLFLMKHYSRPTDEDYMRERLQAGVVYGAFCGKDITGFIGQHAEGSIGMLEVLPQFRRTGIAMTLESFLVNKLLSQGRVPFSQIVLGNTASIELHKKLGFTISEKTLSWLT